MEIQVGDYVRTEWGIRQVKKITIEPEVDIGIAIMPEVTALWTSESEYFEAKDIYKHSKNIIDLIEVGDYVNRELVVDIMEFYETLDDGTEKYCGRKLLTQYRIAQYKGTDIAYYIYQDDIKSIVTREQFKHIEYEV